MDSVLRALAIYFFLILVFRISGKRTFAEVTPFDFVLMLIVAETTQQGLIGDDFSVTNACILIVTLIGTDIFFSLLKRRYPRLDRISEGLPVIVLEHGVPIREHMHKTRIDENDILLAARQTHGLERLEQIKYAVLERNGGISIIPAKD